MNGAPTPVNASDRIWYNLDPFLLARRFAEIEAPRDYAIIIPNLPASPIYSSRTSPFPDPTRPAKFWRYLVQEKATKLPEFEDGDGLRYLLARSRTPVAIHPSADLLRSRACLSDQMTIALKSLSK
jgi:hypothetical protein